MNEYFKKPSSYINEACPLQLYQAGTWHQNNVVLMPMLRNESHWRQYYVIPTAFERK